MTSPYEGVDLPPFNLSVTIILDRVLGKKNMGTERKFLFRKLLSQSILMCLNFWHNIFIAFLKFKNIIWYLSVNFEEVALLRVPSRTYSTSFEKKILRCVGWYAQVRIGDISPAISSSSHTFHSGKPNTYLSLFICSCWRVILKIQVLR